ncbi:hypothetical protein RF11_10431 [Thelohanellus kitauei]|uniref:Uncharacterized protein n=1 Tax=Thelohanellus kitauei TaxID=669202 RepID=A0A0C2JZQ6_THEKT|nr:hypothetical protein RF11_10431 [Thelohanellus kitauei]
MSWRLHERGFRDDWLQVRFSSVNKNSCVSHSINPLYDSSPCICSKLHEKILLALFQHALKLYILSKPGSSIKICLKTSTSKWKPSTSICCYRQKSGGYQAKP